MPKGQKFGGRKKGTPNKPTKEVSELLHTLGCSPIEGMARIAMDETIDIGIRAQMYKELAQYVFPKRKSVEMTVAMMNEVINAHTRDQLLTHIKERVKNIEGESC